MQILVSDHDDGIYQSVVRAFHGKYNVLPLPKDSVTADSVMQYQADLILLIISFEDTEAINTCDMIKKIPEMKNKPVIFLAKQADLELENKALSLGADDYITMPVTEELLLHRVSACLELAGLRQERPYVDKYQDAISFSFAQLVECRDETTGGHLKNTTGYFNILLQEAMASDKYKEVISSDNVSDLLRSAMLHDIGKLGITDEVLRKESSLDYNEFEQMKTHTTLGKQAFDDIIRITGGSRWLNLARDMAYCHHERWDGKGYPNGLKGEEIPLYARMLTIADVYDALTSDRSYKIAYSHQKALEIIKEGRGSNFDPYLVDLFVKSNQRFEELMLSSKESLNQ